MGFPSKLTGNRGNALPFGRFTNRFRCAGNRNEPGIGQVAPKPFPALGECLILGTDFYNFVE